MYKLEQLELNDYDKIVIFSPHPDDELLGCSSILFNEELRDKLNIVYLTDGCFYNYPTIRSKEAATIRKRELENLCATLKINHYYCGIRDTHLGDTNEDTIKEMIENALVLFDCTNDKKIAFFVPHQKEIHDDHRQAFFKVRNAILALNILTKNNTKLYEYEVWAHMEKPTYFGTVDPYKKAYYMKTIYASQNTGLDYIESILGSNKYRGMQQLTKNYYEVFQ